MLILRVDLSTSCMLSMKNSNKYTLKPTETSFKIFIKDKNAKKTNVGNFINSFFRQTAIEIKLLIIPMIQNIIEQIDMLLLIFS